MFYLVGLGNPGAEYELTRHNVAWLVLDRMREELALPNLVASAKYAGRISEGVIVGQSVTILYPDTFMNKSGSAVAKLVSPKEIEHLIVVYDDVDLPLGEIKVSVGRGDGGHNGIKSIIGSLGSKAFVRIRVGISPRSFWTKDVKRPKGEKLPRYVLGKFTKRELSEVAKVAGLVTTAVELTLTKGVEAAMNECN